MDSTTMVPCNTAFVRMSRLFCGKYPHQPVSASNVFADNRTHVLPQGAACAMTDVTMLAASRSPTYIMRRCYSKHILVQQRESGGTIGASALPRQAFYVFRDSSHANHPLWHCTAMATPRPRAHKYRTSWRREVRYGSLPRKLLCCHNGRITLSRSC